MQRGEVDVVFMGTKGSPPGAGNPEAVPHSIFDFPVAVVMVLCVCALLTLGSSSRVRGEEAFANPASSKVT